MGPTGRTKRDAVKAALEREAAEVIEARIADGRPPDVWRAAAEHRSARGLAAEAWYGRSDTPAPIGPPAIRPDSDVRAAVGRDLIPRSVRLPLSAAPAVGPRRWTRVPRVVAEASN